MGRSLPNVTDTEWSVLQLLWDRGPCTVRQLADVLYPRGGPSEYATVHKLLERLEAKGYVRRERSGGVFLLRGHDLAAEPWDVALAARVLHHVDPLDDGVALLARLGTTSTGIVS